MITFPPAKINLGLLVKDKREDGFRNLESFFYSIELKDILEVQPNTVFKFTSSGLDIPGDESNNLVCQAFRLLKEEFAIPDVHFHLHKIIPMGAGLGGGSSDGAFALMMLNDLFELNLSEKQLLTLAGKLGSDCPYFIKKSPCYVTGRGEILKPIQLNLNGYFIKVINPGIHISTKEAFEGMLSNSSILLEEDIINTPIEQWKDFLVNDFEKTVFLKHPELKNIKAELYQEGAIYASMTGTGSTIYGIFKEKPEPSYSTLFEYIAEF